MDSLKLVPSCEADSLSASQGNPHFLWEPKIHSRLHNRPHSFDVDVSGQLQPHVFFRGLTDHVLTDEGSSSSECRDLRN
jgi:hypothetical protein